MADMSETDRLADLAELLIRAKALSDVQNDELLLTFIVRALFRTGQLIAKSLDGPQGQLGSPR